jgi:asparagine synthetase B (glutamine-hydrolysing)
MCGYWYSNSVLPTNTELKNMHRRGPHGNGELDNSLGCFRHALLKTRPPSASQPAQNRYGVLLYNGSVYNTDENDTEWLLAQLDNRPDHFAEVVRSLRGEYSITWVTDQYTMWCTDQFRTRNLWYYFSEQDRVISVSSTPDILRAKHTGAWPCVENTIYVLDRHSWQITTTTITDWNFDQTVPHWDHVFECFEQAVQLRWSDHAIVPLSSGYDSGVIACCASKVLQQKPETASFRGRENIQILSDRLQHHRGHSTILRDTGSPDQYTADILEITRQISSSGVEADRYRTISQYGLSKGKYIHLTGRGGDEIYADYGFKGVQIGQSSNFGGYFPDNLELIWPWYQGDLIQTNAAQDFMYGYHGVEARVPLLDQVLVQAWFNTTHTLKNRKYKGWMAEYMKMHDYPLDENDKKIAGFPCTVK